MRTLKKEKQNEINENLGAGSERLREITAVQDKVRSHAQKESAVPPPTPPGVAEKPRRGAEGGRGETDKRSGDECGSTSGTKGFRLEMVGRDKGSEKRGRHFFPLKLVFNGKAYWTETWTRVT